MTSGIMSDENKTPRDGADERTGISCKPDRVLEMSIDCSSREMRDKSPVRRDVGERACRRLVLFYHILGVRTRILPIRTLTYMKTLHSWPQSCNSPSTKLYVPLFGPTDSRLMLPVRPQGRSRAGGPRVHAAGVLTSVMAPASRTWTACGRGLLPPCTSCSVSCQSCTSCWRVTRHELGSPALWAGRKSSACRRQADLVLA